MNRLRRNVASSCRDRHSLILLLCFAERLPSRLVKRGSVSASAASPTNLKSTSLKDVDKQKLNNLTRSLPLAFEGSKAPGSSLTEFVCRGRGYALMLSGNQALLASSNDHQLVRLTIEGANPLVAGIGIDELPGRRNYFVGNDPAKWRLNVPTFRRVEYQQIYPGIDLTYYGNQQQLEYDFTIAPGADPKAIRLAFNRSARPRISAAGDLILRAGGAEVRQHKPVIYQEVDGQRRPVQGRYILSSKGQIGFDIGSYDRGRPLVIDPTLVYSTYLGGSGDDIGNSIAVDNSNNVSSSAIPARSISLAERRVWRQCRLADIFVTDRCAGQISSINLHR